MIKYQLMERSFRSLYTCSTRCSSKHKTAMEKLPRDPKKLVTNEPPKIPKSIYSEDDKLNLWKSLGHFDLTPPYPKFTDEEQRKIQVGYLENVQILGVTKPKERPNEIEPTELPYNEIYADGVDENNFTKVQSITDREPERWYWVDRLLAKPIVKRENFEPGKRYPSGIRIPKEPPNLPYFVQRTRNHLLPVYKLVERGDEERPKTMVCKIDGDVWELEQELRTRLEANHQKRILTAVNEVKGELRFAGNYVFEVVKYLEEMGF